MKLNVSIQDDEKLRREVKDLIRGQVKSIVADITKAVVKDYLDKNLSEAIKREVTARLATPLARDEILTNARDVAADAAIAHLDAYGKRYFDEFTTKRYSSRVSDMVNELVLERIASVSLKVSIVDEELTNDKEN